VVTTDGIPSVIRNKADLMLKSKRVMDKQNPESDMELHCIIH